MESNHSRALEEDVPESSKRVEQVVVPKVEVKSWYDSAWYDAEIGVEKLDNGGSPTWKVRVHFKEFEEDDELWTLDYVLGKPSIRDVIRPLSIQLQDADCESVTKGMRVCAVHKSKNHERKYYDAYIHKVQRKHVRRKKMDRTVCNCIFHGTWEAGPDEGQEVMFKCCDICLLSEGDVESHPAVKEILEYAEIQRRVLGTFEVLAPKLSCAETENIAACKLSETESVLKWQLSETVKVTKCELPSERSQVKNSSDGISQAAVTDVVPIGVPIIRSQHRSPPVPSPETLYPTKYSMPLHHGREGEEGERNVSSCNLDPTACQSPRTVCQSPKHTRGEAFDESQHPEKRACTTSNNGDVGSYPEVVFLSDDECDSPDEMEALSPPASDRKLSSGPILAEGSGSTGGASRKERLSSQTPSIPNVAATALRIENLEIDTQPEAVLDMMSNISKGVISVHLLQQQYPFENSRIGYAFFEDGASVGTALAFFKDCLVASASGRPWVVSEEFEALQQQEVVGCATTSAYMEEGTVIQRKFRCLPSQRLQIITATMEQYKLSLRLKELFEQQRRHLRQTFQRFAKEEAACRAQPDLKLYY